MKKQWFRYIVTNDIYISALNTLAKNGVTADNIIIGAKSIFYYSETEILPN